MDQIDAQEERLQQYFDGELSPAEAAEVEAQLQRDPGYAERYQSLLRLRELITLCAEESSSQVDSETLYQRVERDVAGGARAPGLLERFAVWWKELAQHRPVLAYGAPLAAMAALLIVLWPDRGLAPSPEGQRARTPTALEQGQPPSEHVRYEKPKRPEVALAQGPEQAPASSEVVQVDFGDNTGTVFEIALADGVSTPVVWINDEE